MALDETTGSSPETRRHRRRKKHPAIGSFQDAPSQAAAEAIAQNKGSHAPTPASDAGAREARRRARQARREAAQASKVALAHLQATLHENQLDPWRGMGPSPQEAGRQQYLSNLRDMPDYRTFDWKDARIPIMLSAGIETVPEGWTCEKTVPSDFRIAACAAIPM